MIVGEAPGGDEEVRGQNFVGASGALLNDALRQAGLQREGIPCANVVCHRPPRNDIENFITKNKHLAIRQGLVWSDRLRLYVAPFVEDQVTLLRETIRKVNPNVIIALGNTPMQVLCGESGITSWRGSLLESRIIREDTQRPYKVLATYHPAAVLRMYPWMFVLVQDLRRAKREAESPDIAYPKYSFCVQPTEEQTHAWLDRIDESLGDGAHELSIDIETSLKQTSCIGFAPSETDAICIPLMDLRKPEGSYWTAKVELEIVKRIRGVLLHQNLRAIGQNFGYDKVYLWRDMLACPPTSIDTSTYHHTNWALLPKKVSFQASLFCKYYRYWKDEGKSKEEKKTWNPQKTDWVSLWTYNCKDCVITYELAQVQKQNAEKLGRTHETIILANGERHSPISFQMALDLPTTAATLRGVRIDQSERRRLTKELSAEIDELQVRLSRIAGHPLNPRSPKQMKAFFYHDLGCQPVLSKKTKAPTLDDEALTTVGKRRPELRPVLDIISNIRSGTVFNSTFLKAALREGRFHCTYDRDGTATYRFSSRKDPMEYGANGQNIPAGFGPWAKVVRELGGHLPFHQLFKVMQGHNPKIDEPAAWKVLVKEEEAGLLLLRGQPPDAHVTYLFSLPNVRKMFIPDEGKVIGDWDLDRADLQVVAWLACEFDPTGPTQELKQALKSGVDLHAEHAKIIGASRDMAKRFIHGTNYVGSARTMAANCGVTVHASENMQRRYFSARPGIKRWHDDVYKQLQTRHSVRSKYGYECFFFDRPDALLPKAVAWEPQHTVAIVINTGWMNLDRCAPEIDVMMQVHDSLVLQAPDVPDLAPVSAKVKSLLSVVVPFDDPLVIPTSGGWSRKTWAEAKG
jgi:DNA polymerase